MVAALAPLILPALIPVISDAVRGVVGRFTDGAGARPQNVEEQISLMNASTEKIKAMAELDRPSGNISQWVADLRASFRYIAAGLIIAAAVATLWIPTDPIKAELAWEAAKSAFSFIFGDRMYAYIKRGK